MNYIVLINECWNTPLTNYGALIKHSISPDLIYIDKYYYDFYVFIAQCFVFLIIWFLPNYIYFKRREKIFN